MPDREKVLQGLKCCRDLDPPNDWECPEECPYSIESNPCRCCKFTPLLDDAIALLEEQEPVVATWYQVDTVFGLEDGYKCGECNAEIAPQMRYCPYCGRKVDWNVLSRILQEAGQKPLAGLQAQAQINTGEQEDYEPNDKTEAKAGGKRDD